MKKARNFFARIEQRRKERRTTSLYDDDKIGDEFEVALKQTEPSAFDVAVEEARKSDAEAWAKLERGMKP